MFGSLMLPHVILTWYQSARVENLCSRLCLKGEDTGMASLLPTEKLGRKNYTSWSYKMHQYLLGHGYRSYVEGENDTTPESTHRDFPAWEKSENNS